MMGRRQSTGRFDARQDLVAFVWARWIDTKSNITDIGIASRVSSQVVANIISSKEGFEEFTKMKLELSSKLMKIGA
jgi:hypothetical protein